MTNEFTAIIERDGEWYIAYCPEIPSANGQGRTKEAMSHYREALRINPHNIVAHYNLANALVSQGRLMEATKHYADAVRIEPAFAEAHNNLGNILLRQGRLEEARRHFSEAIRIKPQDPRLRRSLERTLRPTGKSGGVSKEVLRP